MALKNKTTNVYTEWKPLIDALSDEEAGRIFKNIFEYQAGLEVKSDNPVWLFIKSKIDDYNSKGEQISEKRRENGKLGGLAKASKCQQMVANGSKSKQILANSSKSSNKIKENKIKNICNTNTQEKKYKFNGKVIHLTEKDFNSWRDEFSMIDLVTELDSLDEWYYKNGVTDWFFRTKQELKKRHLAKCPRKSDGSIIEHPCPYL